MTSTQGDGDADALAVSVPPQGEACSLVPFTTLSPIPLLQMQMLHGCSQGAWHTNIEMRPLCILRSLQLRDECSSWLLRSVLAGVLIRSQAAGSDMSSSPLNRAGYIGNTLFVSTARCVWVEGGEGEGGEPLFRCICRIVFGAHICFVLHALSNLVRGPLWTPSHGELSADRIMPMESATALIGQFPGHRASLDNLMRGPVTVATPWQS